LIRDGGEFVGGGWVGRSRVGGRGERQGEARQGGRETAWVGKWEKWEKWEKVTGGKTSGR
jgi:hypothetical protein